MLFPTLAGMPHGVLDLGAAARSRPLRDERTGASKYLDPIFCTAFVEMLHRQHGIQYSYGGYLENRRELWAGSYLEHTTSFLHLGIDCNAPAGTPVALDFPATIVQVGTDFPEQHGWGTYVVAVLSIPGSPAVPLLYAHLAPQIAVLPGDMLGAGSVLGVVGAAPQNGNWYPHVHIQAFSANAYHLFVGKGIRSIDGYCSLEQLAEKRRAHPDPSPYIEL